MDFSILTAQDLLPAFTAVAGAVVGSLGTIGVTAWKNSTDRKVREESRRETRFTESLTKAQELADLYGEFATQVRWFESRSSTQKPAWRETSIYVVERMPAIVDLTKWLTIEEFERELERINRDITACLVTSASHRTDLNGLMHSLAKHGQAVVIGYIRGEQQTPEDEMNTRGQVNALQDRVAKAFEAHYGTEGEVNVQWTDQDPLPLDINLK